MGIYRDSVGNTYDSLPPRKPVHTAKSTRSNAAGKKGRSTRNGKPFGMNGGCGCETCRRSR